MSSTSSSPSSTPTPPFSSLSPQPPSISALPKRIYPPTPRVSGDAPRSATAPALGFPRPSVTSKSLPPQPGSFAPLLPLAPLRTGPSPLSPTPSESTASLASPQSRTAPPVPVPTGETRIQLALDYGTTFTGVAYLSIPASKESPSEIEALADGIKVIQTWPGNQESKKVPSEYSYSRTPRGYKQWGYNIDDNSLVLKRTKIQLEEVRERVKELRTLSELLYNLRSLDLSRKGVTTKGVPNHLAKEPEDIVRDYLGKIADKVVEELSTRMVKVVTSEIPIDLVVTHPAIWSHRALNSTYRAVRASFNVERFPKLGNIAFVAEPVACAHYTLREAWSKDRLRFIKGDCFIVVDAGGGTVDLASYKVVEIDHDTKHIRLEQIGEPIGETCGSTTIDKSFERFAQERLGPEDWAKLTEDNGQSHSTGGHSIARPGIRKLQEKFQPIKHSFGKDKNSRLDFPIPLPRSVSKMEDDGRGVSNGALMITSDDLRGMFHESVERTLYLIEQGVTFIEVVEKRTVKNIFLSGGFAQSPYLFSKVEEYGKEKGIQVERGDDCWIAVAKGAILKTLGVYTDKPKFVKPCPRHYGIKVRRPYASYENHLADDVEKDARGTPWATDQIRWLINKGDALFPGKPNVMTYECTFEVKASDFIPPKSKRSSQPVPQMAVFRDVVFVASSQDSPPNRFDPKIPSTEQQVVTIKCDLTQIPRDDLGDQGPNQAGRLLAFPVTVEVRVLDKVVIKVKSGENVLVSQEVAL